MTQRELIISCWLSRAGCFPSPFLQQSKNCHLAQGGWKAGTGQGWWTWDRSDMEVSEKSGDMLSPLDPSCWATCPHHLGMSPVSVALLRAKDLAQG